MDRSSVNFYCPSRAMVEAVPGAVADYWGWINDILPKMAAIEPSGPIGKWHGPPSWTIQTWMQLRERGYRCNLVSTIPDQGIILSHSDFWDPDLVPSDRQFFVEIKPDRKQSLRHAHFTIVQTPSDPLCRDSAEGPVGSVNYWPQPNLIPRDSGRGHSVEHAYYLGNPNNFSPKVGEVRGELSKLGIEFKMPPRPLWHDYTEADLIIAVRRGGAVQSNGTTHSYLSTKPANKLTNAWLAGVPAILSPEPSFLGLRESELDFLPASNVEEITSAARRLKEDKDLYLAMVENGRRRGSTHSAKAVADQWIALLDSRIIPAYAAMRGHAIPRAL